MIKESYEGIVITYDERDNTWKNSENEKSYESLVKAKESIDRMKKAKSTFSPIKILYQDYNEMKEATITSVPTEDSAWLKFEKTGKREKVDFKYIHRKAFECSEDNKKRLRETIILTREIHAIEEKIENIKNSMTVVSISDLYKACTAGEKQ